MAQVLPPALQAVIDAFGALPGVGARTAERYAYSLLKRDPSVARQLAGALEDLPGGVGYCTKTFALVPAGQSLSDLYTDPRRDKTVVAVVAEPFDVVALEKTGQYHGRVAVRATGSFNIQTKDGVIQGIGWRHCQLLQRADGYGYCQASTSTHSRDTSRIPPHPDGSLAWKPSRVGYPAET